ncbi:hypothetical protein [Leptolyngbya sp. O-77]|uniref:hypothetical protein n=1 Tax=Leptolyngbya sp. O-77 TaxID=1080068 RepID=UPI000838DF35|nr:hypothetical protein [Leptolyngbya sp. O-77]
MNPQDLVSDRIQLHYAVQFIAAVGAALGKPQPDGSQVTLDWDEALFGFIGKPIPDTSIQLVLLPGSLTSVILKDGAAIASLPLAGQTMQQALDWHKAELAKLGVATDSIKLLEYPPDDFPDHPLAHGAAFEVGNSAGREAVAAYFAQTQPLLEKIVAENPAAAAIAIWPHHFDMATLMTYAGPTEADTKYLGVGLSPGDPSYSEPYWYISPYPYPELSDLPALESGNWHTDHWVGAVLKATQITKADDLPVFVDRTVSVAKQILSVPESA